jgi:hypothetical protein
MDAVAAATTVTLVVADLLTSSLDVAVIVTVAGEAGAVHIPPLVIDP